MELQFDAGIIEWLSTWPGDFEWDEGNRDKNEKHGIAYLEIEQIFEFPVYVAGRIVETGDEARWLLLGEVNVKRWALIVTLRGHKLRVISCRRQRKKEVEFYETFKKEIESPDEKH